MLFDSHAHLNDERFDEDRDILIENLEQNGVGTVVVPASDIASSITAIELAEKYPFIYAAVGVHPHEVDHLTDSDIDRVRELALSTDRVKAIGEIGLDYYYDFSPRDKQKDWFKRQIELANELELPFIVHDRDAHGDVFDIIKEYRDPERAGCVMHCYSGALELAQEYVKLGCYISLSGSLTFKNNKKTVEVAKHIPLDRLFIETDSPYLAPVPMRGKRNEPAFVKYVAQRIAVEKNISTEEVIKATEENAKRFFGI